MARRSDHTHDEIREMAVEAGLGMIREYGMAYFSARRLAAEIGYTVGTLYNVFGSYDDIIVHLNARTLDSWFADMLKAVNRPNGGDPVQQLATFYLSWSGAHYHEWSALFEYKYAPGYELPDWYPPKYERFFALVETLLLPHVGTSRRKARRAARVLFAGIHGIAALSHTGKLAMLAGDSAPSLARSFVESYLAGLRLKNSNGG